MQKTILLTGATDGIGFATAEMLVSKGHHLLVHGRNPQKLEAAKQSLQARGGDGSIETLCADLSDLDEVLKFAGEVLEKQDTLDVLINNAGIFRTSNPITVTVSDGDESTGPSTL